MDDIRLPMIQGTMEDISQEADSQSDHTGDSLNSQSAKAIYEREAHITINYDKLDEEYTEVRMLFITENHSIEINPTFIIFFTGSLS